MSSIGDLIFWAIVVAIIFSLVRPGSVSGQAIVDLTNALAAVVGVATGYVQRS